jgi:Putative ABC exporter
VHPALWKLYRLSQRAAFRRLLRGARTLRGALVLLFLIGGVGFWLVCMAIMTVTLRDVPETLKFAGTAAPYLPLLLMALFLQRVLGNGGTLLLHFSPSEVDFLFAAPFHRRELLLYKVVRMGLGLVLVALVVSSTPLLYCFNGWLSMFVGLSLSLIFINLAGLATTLTRLIVAEAAHTRARRVLLFWVTTLVVIALPQTVARARVLHFAELATSFGTTWPGRVMLAPFEVFSHATLAGRWFPDLVGWAGAAVAIDLGLLMLVLKLDADYLEWSAAISDWVYELQQRVRKSGGLTVRPAWGGFQVRPFPWLGGAGPIAWRQLVLTIRKCAGMMWTALFFTIVVLIWNWLASGRLPLPTITPGLVLGIFSYGTYLFGTLFPVAFRGDLEQIEVLKTLPVHPMALAAGELSGCSAVMAGFQLAFLAVYGIIAQSGGWLLLAAAVLAPPIAWHLLASSNLLFLIYPVVSKSASPGDLDLNAVGRALFSLFLQVLILVPLLGIPAGLSGVVYLATGFSWAWMIATAVVALLVEAVPMTMLVAWAFDRFDPSLDTPA